VPTESIFADPQVIGDARGASKKLGPMLRMSQERTWRQLSRPGHFVWLRRRAPQVFRENILNLRLPGVGVMPEMGRLYPHGQVGAHVVGFVDGGNRGACGIELALDRVLAGRDGTLSVQVDARGYSLPGKRRSVSAPVRGRNVRLTIDLDLQRIAETALAQGVKDSKALGGTALVMDPATGEILALACWPTFDPNRYSAYPARRWLNQAVSCPFEPGSIFKIVVATAAIEEGVARPGEPVVYCCGQRPIGNHIIHCAVHGRGGHGSLDVAGVVVKSCNIGAAELARRVGRERLYRYIRRFGFGQATNQGLLAEANGWVSKPSKWTPVVLANVAFGQSVSATASQVLAAYCSIANGGLLPWPHLIQQVEGRDGERGVTFRPVMRRVCSRKTAELMSRILQDVVIRGTGKAAQVPGYRVAGKTGTAQKATPQAGFRAGKYVSSFVGYLPGPRPRVAIMVTLDEPQGGHYGGVVAAPVFKTIAAQAMSRLGIPPLPQSEAQTAHRGRP
jgi:cell division protein FtsI/penicillin-binding protein 2